MKRTIAIPFVLAGLLAGCGAKNELVPPKGASLPPTPYGANAAPDAAQLLDPRPAARPERSDDILKDSKERESDPFDLPPSR